MSDTKKKPISNKTGTSKSPRRRAREFALQGLYQWKVGGADEAAIEAHMQGIAGFDKADRNFFLDILRGALAHLHLRSTPALAHP